MTNIMSTRRRYLVLAGLTVASWSFVAMATEAVFHIAR